MQKTDRFYYGYGVGLVVDETCTLIGFSSTYPLADGQRLVTQRWQHSIGDKIGVVECADHGFFVEEDICTLGT